MTIVAVPTYRTLEALLGRIYGCPVEILDRRPLAEGTSPKEVVLADVGTQQAYLFCKYGAHHDRGPTDHRSGVAYEAAMYKHVLPLLGDLVTPAVGIDDDDGRVALVLPFIDGVRANKVASDGVISAARWLGEFHCAAARRLQQVEHVVTRVHDEHFHRPYLDRFTAAVRTSESCPTWLEAVERRAMHAMEAMSEAAHTVVHGEFYPKNILIGGGTVAVVDWESAAVGSGWWDLAALVDGWPAEVVEGAKDVYMSAAAVDPAQAGAAWEATELLHEIRWAVSQRHGPDAGRVAHVRDLVHAAP